MNVKDVGKASTWLECSTDGGGICFNALGKGSGLCMNGMAVLEVVIDAPGLSTAASL